MVWWSRVQGSISEAQGLEVRDLISIQGWDLFSYIDELTYWELMIDVMSSFELNHTIPSLGHRETISFQMFSEQYMMSYKDFFCMDGADRCGVHPYRVIIIALSRPFVPPEPRLGWIKCFISLGKSYLFLNNVIMDPNPLRPQDLRTWDLKSICRRMPGIPLPPPHSITDTDWVRR